MEDRIHIKMVYIPILGAIANAAGTVIDKAVLEKRSISPKVYVPTAFFMIIVVMLPFLYFFWGIDPLAWEKKNLIIFGVVILFSLIGNILMANALKWEEVGNLVSARILQPLFVVLLALLFSFFIDSGLYDRNLNVVVPAIIAGLAIVWSHIKRDQLKFNRFFIFAVLGGVFFALELTISRLILDFYSPLTFYFLRCSSIFLLSLAFLRPNLKVLDMKSAGLLLIAGLLWVGYRVIIYSGYVNLGVIYTTLLVMLYPVFLFIFAHIFLKEKIKKKEIIASGIIIACVGYALLA